MDKLKTSVLHGVKQFKRLWRTLLILYIPILILYIILALIIHASDNLRVSHFFRDVSAIAQLPPYTGMISQLGLMTWSASAAVCIFALLLLLSGQNSTPATRRFLLHSAIFSTILLLDDTFLLHESVIPDTLGISEGYVYLIYFLLYAGYLMINSNEILRSEYLILGFALMLFATSMFVDKVPLHSLGLSRALFGDMVLGFVEEGSEFAGTVTWLVYLTRYAFQALQGVHIPSITGIEKISR